ncbi:hypothetical protein BJ170DRAFT_85364 [Xylariales sp. AK1849]|nr:hypothetical protein BJ170DRAFT_85364 [Xylariales sp. AK1849]
MAQLDFPTIYLLPTHIEPDMLPELECQIPTLTYDINEAKIVLGKVSQRGRAIFELRRRKIVTTEVPVSTESELSPSKRRKIVTSDLAPQSDNDGNSTTPCRLGPLGTTVKQAFQDPGDMVRVVKLAWFIDSVSKGMVLPLDEYVVYQGRKEVHVTQVLPLPQAEDILRRARDDGEILPLAHQRFPHGYASGTKHPRTLVPTKRPALLKETTSEHDIDLIPPPIPEFLHTTYSCERPTHCNPPNDAFIETLKIIRTTRALTGDKTGVRAYSTSIATLAAYPHLLTRAQEVSRLPGCGPKIADLFSEWKSTGHLREAENATTDPQLSVLRLFYEIWGVAETTAREFYNKGWRELDDIVEYGWDSLTRVQQIGVKYYDEFLSKIPRAEVETIGNVILAHANNIKAGFQMVIVGGYRRGKQESGDVDVVLSHPNQEVTRNFIEGLVISLEKDGFITHTLTLSTKNSERGQAPLAWKGEDRTAGAGFDTLDKALVVWQDPSWDRLTYSKNPNPHRRVDIIISPWKTVGCAVVGWSGGTTFQRDLRRYCKKVKSMKFDSSGIRSRIDGHWVDLERGPGGQGAPDMLAAERRVFDGLGLEWRPPEQRCTG